MLHIVARADWPVWYVAHSRAVQCDHEVQTRSIGSAPATGWRPDSGFSRGLASRPGGTFPRSNRFDHNAATIKPQDLSWTKIVSQAPPETWAAKWRKATVARLATPRPRLKESQTRPPEPYKTYTAKPATRRQTRRALPAVRRRGWEKS